MRIEIISIPKGSPPLWIRKAMVGLVFSVIEPKNFNDYKSIRKEDPKVVAKAMLEVYFVAKADILVVLIEKNNSDAVEWFEGTEADSFIFMKIYCRQTI